MIADIESPYGSDDPDTLKRNILYARLACRWALQNNLVPYASHLFFTQPGILDDGIPEDREQGIQAGKSLVRNVARMSLFFLDLGESQGMKHGREDAKKYSRRIMDVCMFNKDMKSSSYTELLHEAQRIGLVDEYSRAGWEI